MRAISRSCPPTSASACLQASILFATFAGVLWGLSSEFSFRIGDRDYAIPGFMVWAAILYASAGSLMSFFVGRGLVGRNAERYAREADLRFSLVRVNEHVDAISLAEGEADEKRRIELNLEQCARRHPPHRLGSHPSHLGDRRLRLGDARRAHPGGRAAVFHGQDLLRRPDDGRRRFHAGAILAALVHRQLQRHRRLARHLAARRELPPRARSRVHEPHGFESRITYLDGEPGAIAIDDLEIVPSANADLLEGDRVVEVRAGERVLVLGAPGTGKTQLFRALAGLWPWGAGEITRPRGEQIFYLPRGTPICRAARCAKCSPIR